MRHRVKSAAKINETKECLFVLQFSISQNGNKGKNMVNTGTAALGSNFECPIASHWLLNVVVDVC